MSKSFEFELNYSGVGKLLKGKEMQNLMKEYGSKVQSKAVSDRGRNYSLSVGVGTTRAHANISTTDIVSQRSNMKNNTLLKALGGSK